MAYDEELAARVRDVLGDAPDVMERKMFGGLAFMLSGNMACGIVGADLMLRLGDDGADAALDQPHVRPMDFTHRPMKSHGLRGSSGCRDGRSTALMGRQGGRFCLGTPAEMTVSGGALGSRRRVRVCASAASRSQTASRGPVWGQVSERQAFVRR